MSSSSQLYTPFEGYRGATDYNWNENGFGKHLVIPAVVDMHPRLHWMANHIKLARNEKGELLKGSQGELLEDPTNKIKVINIFAEASAMSQASHNAYVLLLEAYVKTNFNVNINQMPMGFGGNPSETTPTVLHSGDKIPKMAAVPPFVNRTPGGRK